MWTLDRTEYFIGQSRLNNNNEVIPILTNGKEWVLFNMSSFREKPFCPIIKSKVIRAQAKLTDKNFYEKIIKKIKNINIY